MKPFSAVIPVRYDESDLIKQTLASWCRIKPDEIILCFDRLSTLPKMIADPELEQDATMQQFITKSTAATICHENGIPLLILEVPYNKGFKFHQAWVRRSGFYQARNDFVLTGDSDLFLYPSAIKAVESLQDHYRNGVGLVSIGKRRVRLGLLGGFRNFMERSYHAIGRNLLRHSHLGKLYFTGLYAVYRPYWLRTEPVEAIKSLQNPKYAEFAVDSWGGYTGEDTHLRNWMMTQFKVHYLQAIGAFDTRLSLEEQHDIQFRIGRKKAYDGQTLFRILLHCIIRLRPHVLSGYFYQRFKPTQKIDYALSTAREYWRFAPSFTLDGSGKQPSSFYLKFSGERLKEAMDRLTQHRIDRQGASAYHRVINQLIIENGLRTMLDFGCGLGTDGVFFGKDHNLKVVFADIVEDNLKLASKHKRLFGFDASTHLILDSANDVFGKFDLILANGVLHHIPDPRPVVANLVSQLNRKGFFVIMLYTKKHYRAMGARTLEHYSIISEGRTNTGINNPYSTYYSKKQVDELFNGLDVFLLEQFTTNRGKFGWYVYSKK